MEQRSLEMVEMGTVTGRHLILIVERNWMSREGDKHGRWGEASPRALIVVDGMKTYTYSFKGASLSLAELREGVVGLNETLELLERQE